MQVFHPITLNYHTINYTVTAMAESGTHTITFKDEDEKAKAFFELIHSGASFRGIGKNKFVVSDKDCKTLKTKRIKYYEID